MSLAAIGLIFMAAIFHASWNALAKGRRDIFVFFFGLTVVALVIFAAPFAYFANLHPPTWRGAPFVVVSALTQIAYYIFLSRAYARNDLSFAYPIARGTGVLLVPLFAMPIFGDRPTALAWCGIALILIGVAWMHSPGFNRALEKGNLRSAFSAPIILTGISIATYSLIDSAGVKRVHPLVYLYLTFAVIAVLMAPYILMKKREALYAEVRQRWPVLAGGLAVFGTYCIVLAAFRLAPVSYVVPMREMSIVFGALLGVRLLNEPFGRTRILSCVVVAIGVLAIGIAG
jgi:drug/metabolite transporter (DMT)-like permease